MMFLRICTVQLVSTILIALSASADAASVIDWNLDTSINSSTSLTGASTDSPILGDGTSDNAENSAIWASFPETVLPDGQGIRLSGEVDIAGSTPGLIKFRWGLFREVNIGAPDPTSGWLGYSFGNSNMTSGGLAIERVPGGSGFDTTSFTSLSTTHAQSIASSLDPGSAPFEDGTYQFEMTLARNGPNIDVFGSLDSDSFSNSWSVPDISPASGLDATFNRVGLVAGEGMRADQLQFRNLDVSPVTDPPQIDPPQFRCSATKSCFVDKQFDNGQGVTMPYQLLLPSGHDEPSAKFPLVLYMHGSEGPGIFNGLVDSSQTEEFPSFILAPQNSFAGGGWGPHNDQDLTLEILEEVIEQYAIDERRIYITGISAGGFGTERFVLNNPSQFAAAVPQSGLFTISPDEVEQIKDVPLWAFHGERDRPEQARKFIADLEQAGGTPQYTEIPRGGHNIWNPIYSDWETGTYGLYPWLFSQSLPVPEPSTTILVLLGSLSATALRREGRARNRSKKTLGRAISWPQQKAWRSE